MCEQARRVNELCTLLGIGSGEGFLELAAGRQELEAYERDFCEPEDGAWILPEEI